MADGPARIADASPLERRERPRAPFRKVRRADERVRLLGQAMDLMRPEEVLHHVEQWAGARRKALVANHNLNSLALLKKQPALKAFFERADLVEVDSTPLIMFGRMLGSNARPIHRCTYLDWREHFWSLAQRHRWRVLYVGGAPEVVARARDRLTRQYPSTGIRVIPGFFDAAPGSADNAAVLHQCRHFDPHILFVGMGMPRQELWIEQNWAALPAAVVFSVGAAFDYEGGVQKAAPRWMGRLGIEWLFRLAHDPARLARRYLIEPWALTPLIIADVVDALRRRQAGRGAVEIDTRPARPVA